MIVLVLFLLMLFFSITLSTFFLIVANGLFLVAPVVYLRGIWKRKITPNPATWMIWSVVGSVNALTYYLQAPAEEKVLATLSVVSACSFVIVFVISWIKGVFATLEWPEWIAFALTMIICTIWFVIRENAHATQIANGMLQIPMLLGFLPTAYMVVKRKGTEQPNAWLFGASAYVFQIAALICSDETIWTQYLWPVINGLGGNGSVLFAIYWVKSRTLPHV
ncbi:TPA: hypothetical protein DDZ01_01245 [Candidatus Uhrbacteria bacterium]|nr:MAG: hypothetical protein A2332_01000 [Candidatus Uhrbacteria bacterium RIFOXYB2_FULL_41_18]HBK34603.1 hypothetical protein [Candidatus Uhrbacteria bacterium]HCB55657.1 hypothetical protein [Candidatus Uhrbacteria bacterium]